MIPYGQPADDDSHASDLRPGDEGTVKAADDALRLLRECAQGWEPGGGPFQVPLPTVNKIMNLLSSTQDRTE